MGGRKEEEGREEGGRAPAFSFSQAGEGLGKGPGYINHEKGGLKGMDLRFGDGVWMVWGGGGKE